MQWYNDLPRVTSVADGLEPRQSGSRVFSPHTPLCKLGFPGNGDQGCRTDHRKLEGPREDAEGAHPATTSFQGRELSSERLGNFPGSPYPSSNSLAGPSYVTLGDLFNLAKPPFPHL